MEKGLLHWVIENRKVTIFFVLALVIFGLYNYWLVPKQENPQVSPPVAKITTVYPGASPEEVESSITKVIEDELLGIPGYDYTQSFSHHSVSTIILWLEQDADVDEAWEKLRLKMADLQSSLPEGSSEIQINTDLDVTAGFIFSLSGPGYSYEELEEYCEEVKSALAQTPGVSRLEIVGKQEKQLKVLLDIGRLNQLKLSLTEIAQLLQGENVTIPSGNITSGSVRIPVQTSGRFASIREVEDLAVGISPQDGSILRLRDIARVSLEREDYTSKFIHNNQNSLLLVGYFAENRNAVLIGRELEKRLDEVKKRLPEDLLVDEVLYQPRDINQSVSDLMLNLLQGIVFVLLVVYLGMGLHTALVVSTAIPFSILISLSAMPLFGIKLHQISIAGYIIALGMLVDNAIVISDAIMVRLDKGEDRVQACVKGTRDVALPVLTSTLTTIAAYVPLLLLPGVAGEYIRSIPQIVIISLTASYLVAVLVTPVLAYLFIKPGQSSLMTRTAFFSTLKTKVNIAITKKRRVVVLALGAFLLTLLLATQLNLVFFPKADKQLIYLDITCEQSANIKKTEELVEQAVRIIQEQEEVVQYTAAVGDGLPKFFVTLPQPIKSPATAQILLQVDLEKGGRFKNNTQLAEHLQALLDTSIAGATIKVKELEQAEPVEAPVLVRILGDDRERTKQVAEEVKALLREIPGTSNVADDAGQMEYRYLVDINRDLAAQLGFSSYDIQQEISAALSGRAASLLKLPGGEEYEILVKGDINSLSQLENLGIKSSLTGQKAILKQLAEIKLKPELPVVKRFNRERVVNVTSNVLTGYSAVAIQTQLERKMAQLDLEDVEIIFEGEMNKILKYFGNLGTAAIFAVLAIYIIMLVQFGSLLQPLVILLTIPLSAIGSVIGLLVFKQPLSFVALLGIVSLAGVVVNNAIILLDYINWERRQGKDIDEACRSAVNQRIRPILLTTITTVLGLIPLVFSGTLFVPMAVALMSGLMVATLLTLVVIPVVYNILEGLIIS